MGGRRRRRRASASEAGIGGGTRMHLAKSRWACPPLSSSAAAAAATAGTPRSSCTGALAHQSSVHREWSAAGRGEGRGRGKGSGGAHRTDDTRGLCPGAPCGMQSHTQIPCGAGCSRESEAAPTWVVAYALVSSGARPAAASPCTQAAAAGSTPGAVSLPLGAPSP